jgi:mitogen-activated protein kinase kinase kinase 4/mitogen-activated protein kinase kinase kinase
MFQVGSGKIPEIPEILSQEGHDFIHCCLLHDPQSRWSAERLLEHNFCKVSA